VRLASSALVLALPILAAPALAQRFGPPDVTLGVSRADVGHLLMGGGDGLALRAALPIGRTRFTLRLGYERLAGEQSRVGSPCEGGPLPPDAECDPVPFRDEGRLRTAHVGLAMRLLDRGGLRMALTGDARFGRIDVASHGGSRDPGANVASPRRRGKSLWGGDVGAELDWTPSRRVPVTLLAGGAVGHLGPRASNRATDVWMPFEGGLNVERVYLGLGWRASSR